MDAVPLPDREAEIDHVDFSAFVVPDCRSCSGMMKPDVVFFGETVPPRSGRLGHRRRRNPESGSAACSHGLRRVRRVEQGRHE
ncbi:Sir2 family NAD-dependent protein deacetylase [Bradyrhizobium sp. SZCCHNR1039]|uniref:Sir2 family NAD-dependent protein deacetylase n=1 Tax=Bradyrhizobium sp. SZCCHNR1039 TaxID=3057350 RepID=UPI002916D7DE|nr:Sir2 family NAD-dependent protein deacetylase [Bradyrhizobium sp. SZCCHNR1039]